MSRASPLALLGAEALARAQPLFERYLALVLKWNRSIQMVATRDLDELYRVHLVDSLALLPHLPEVGRVVDVGAGGGFPGAVLAIARPGLSVTSLEPIHKKQAFLSAVRREVPLPNYAALAERDDTHLARPDFTPYDAAVSRATFAVPEWLERGLRLVRPGGGVLAMEGREQHPLPPDTERFEYALEDRTRAVLVRRQPNL